MAYWGFPEIGLRNLRVLGTSTPLLHKPWTSPSPSIPPKGKRPLNSLTLFNTPGKMEIKQSKTPKPHNQLLGRATKFFSCGKWIVHSDRTPNLIISDFKRIFWSFPLSDQGRITCASNKPQLWQDTKLTPSTGITELAKDLRSFHFWMGTWS